MLPVQTNIYRMTYMKLDPKISKPVINLVFISVVLIAMLNTENYKILVGLWGVISSMVCPLIVSVLPGSFFYYVLKENDSENKWLRASGIAYCLLGLIIMPIFLTLSTKNLFSTTNTPAALWLSLVRINSFIFSWCRDQHVDHRLSYHRAPFA